MHDSAINDPNYAYSPHSSVPLSPSLSLCFSCPLSALRVVSAVVVVVSIAPGLQFALFFTVYTWPLETHARTHAQHTLTFTTHARTHSHHNSPCVGFFLSALLLILHTYRETLSKQLSLWPRA